MVGSLAQDAVVVGSLARDALVGSLAVLTLRLPPKEDVRSGDTRPIRASNVPRSGGIVGASLATILSD